MNSLKSLSIICVSGIKPGHANKSLKHINIVYDRLARGYGIGNSESLAGRFGLVDSGSAKMKSLLSDVSGLIVGDSCILLGIGNAAGLCADGRIQPFCRCDKNAITQRYHTGSI